jgi:hypothetical protein
VFTAYQLYFISCIRYRSHRSVLHIHSIIKSFIFLILSIFMYAYDTLYGYGCLSPSNTNNKDSEPCVSCIIRKICIRFCKLCFVLSFLVCFARRLSHPLYSRPACRRLNRSRRWRRWLPRVGVPAMSWLDPWDRAWCGRYRPRETLPARPAPPYSALLFLHFPQVGGRVGAGTSL